MTDSETLAVDSKGLALVVDNVPANRKILEQLLIIEGYSTIFAADGAQAVQLYTERHPDIVFMDAMMPVMDGYEATARIKILAGMNFVPVIFLTALSEGDALVRCIEAGGDDFLSKPYKQEVLRAKIKAMERIRDLTREVAEQHRNIEQQRSLLLNEQLAAEQIYNRAITGDNIASKYISTMSRAVSIFSGDLLLSADSPNGSLYILLGDFTGHGLSAAVGVLPTAEVFRAMTAKGFSAAEIMAEINSKLYKLLPTGMFLTACFVVIDSQMQNATIWNAGIPEALIVGSPAPDGGDTVLKHRVTSKYLPLGILKQIDLAPAPSPLCITSGDRILLCSDGVTEAVNSGGEAFGTARYEQAATAGGDSFQCVVKALQAFCGGQEFNDDVSLVEIHCLPGLLHTASAQAVAWTR